MEQVDITKGKIIELEIVDIAFEGPGIAKIKINDKDFVIFVENVAPGDIIEAEIIKIKKNYAIAQKLREISPSKLRITPKCKHFGVCGGCSWQFLKYEDQLILKEKFVKDAFERIGGFDNPKIEKIMGCKTPWFYRNKMEYTFSNNQNGLSIGFHVRKRFMDVFDIEECFLQSEISARITKTVKEWAKKHNLTAYDPRLKTGFLRNLVIREGKNTNERLVNLYVAEESFALADDFEKMLFEKFPDEITSLYWTSVNIKQGFRTLIKENFLKGKKNLTEILNVADPLKLPERKSAEAPRSLAKWGEGGLTFDIAPQAFFQPNPHQAEILYSSILKITEPKKSDIVFDLFCGTGTIGMCFAKFVQKVYGIELNESAIENGRKNVLKNEISNMEFICGDAGKQVAKLKEKPDIVIVDPPRAGISKKSIEKILELKASKIIYVSCNPATLSRDVKILCENSYAIEHIQPVDMFPQTYHVETICLLKNTNQP